LQFGFSFGELYAIPGGTSTSISSSGAPTGGGRGLMELWATKHEVEQRLIQEFNTHGVRNTHGVETL